MVELIPEVGKTYIVELSWDEEDESPSKVLVKVVGTVDPSTIQYEEGYRFYTHIGTMLFGNGSTTLSDENPMALRLKRLAVSEDFKDSLTASTSVDVATADLNLCVKSDNWRASTDPNFKVLLGEVYVDRMGFLQFVEKVRNLSEDPVFVAGMKSFAISGQELQSDDDASKVAHKPSMYDLAFQRI